jgi:uncharacterized membrane protein YphA (DoxX/SURF4 family)
VRVVGYWSNYWFRPAPLLDLAIVRICAVAFQMVYRVFKNNLGLLAELAAVPDALYQPLPVLKLLVLPFGLEYRPSFTLLETIYWLTLVAGLLSLVGLKTKYSLVAFALGNLMIQAYIYSFGDFHHPDALMMIALFILALSPCGKALSLDARRTQPEQPSRPGRARLGSWILPEGTRRSARWPIFIIQWLYALIYLSAAISKLSANGLDWLNGYTVQYYMIRDGVRWGSELGVALGQNHSLAVFVSWCTLLFEATFFLVLIFPKLALIYIPVGIALHTGIYLTQRAPFPQFIVLYCVFVPGSRSSKRCRLISIDLAWRKTGGSLMKGNPKINGGNPQGLFLFL